MIAPPSTAWTGAAVPQGAPRVGGHRMRTHPGGPGVHPPAQQTRDHRDTERRASDHHERTTVWQAGWSTAVQRPRTGFDKIWSEEGFADRTVRQVVRAVGSGTRARVRLSYRFGSAPLEIGGAAPPELPRPGVHHRLPRRGRPIDRHGLGRLHRTAGRRGFGPHGAQRRHRRESAAQRRALVRRTDRRTLPAGRPGQGRGPDGDRARRPRRHRVQRGGRERQEINTWIRTSGAFDPVADFASALAGLSDPRALLPTYDSGDRKPPGDAGYRAMAAVGPASL